MAYDANDPADRAIVEGLIATALEEERETHRTEVERLDKKNKELLGKLKRTVAGEDGVVVGEIERLESELETNKRDLSAAKSMLRETERKLKTVETERDNFSAQAETEGNFSRNLLTENTLTAALIDAKVAPHFMEAAKALLSKGVSVEINGDERKVVANGKSVADYVKEWAASDAGKHYIQANANGGGGSNGANGGGSSSSKKLSEMSEQERLTMARENPAGWQQLLESENNQQTAQP